MNFTDTIQEIFRKIERKGVAILATSADDIPTIRPMSIVIYDNKIAFQTSNKLLKYKQIEQNPVVALNIDNIQINGIATLLPKQALQVEPFITKFKEKHYSSYCAYSHMASNRVIEVTPKTMTIWAYENKEPMRIFIDFKQEKIEKVNYAHSEQD